MRSIAPAISRLDRNVALKVLPQSFAGDTDRLLRFEREAKTLASLNHPHIAQVYGLERSDDTSALVMELVEGEDLAARIARSPIPPDDAMAIARQIAEALEAAHEAGIVHRDLKPANIRIRSDGTVKVLDFGLAKSVVVDGHEPAATVTSPAMTAHGMILGTAAYMSPEQAKGKPVDRRTDIWAFGCVVYEMLTGRRAFEGESVTETIGAVLHQEPDWSAIDPNLPARIRVVLQRCLQKDPRQRVHDIADVKLAMAGAFDAPAASDPAPAAPGRSTASVVEVCVRGCRGAGDRSPRWRRTRYPTGHRASCARPGPRRPHDCRRAVVEDQPERPGSRHQPRRPARRVRDRGLPAADSPPAR